MSIDFGDLTVMEAEQEAGNLEPTHKVDGDDIRLFDFDFPSEKGTAGPVTTGCVVSMMDREFPIITSFTNGDKVQTLAFLNGLPIPYNLFVLGMCARMAPKRLHSQLPNRISENGLVWLKDHEKDRLIRFWQDERDLCADIRPLVKHPAFLLQTKLADLHEEIKKAGGDDDTASTRYKKLLLKIDEDYANSLGNPRAV